MRSLDVHNETEVHNRAYYLIVVSIFVSIFVNSYVFFKQPFEFYLGYLIYLFLMPGFIRRYGFNRNLIWIFGILLVSGIIHVITGDNETGQFIKVFSGLLLSYFFYNYVILEFNFDISQLFKWYLKGAYYAAIIGAVQFISYQIGFKPGYNFRWILNKWGFIPGGNLGIRVNSIFGEPTYLGAVLSAAFFVSLYNMFRNETFYLSKRQSMLIIVIYILSFSGLGQVGIFLSLLFLAVNFGLVRYLLLVIPASILLFNILYNNSRDFQERFDSLIGLFTTGKFQLGKTHGSSFILYNNYVVATENFKHNSLFGSGIGSHPTAFSRYSSAKNFKVYGFNLNSQDANSMLLRLISETGIFGVGIFVYIIFVGFVRRDSDCETYHWLVSNSILVMILLNLFRQGHYFLNGFPFFVLLYFFNGVSYKLYRETGRTLYEHTITESGLK